LLFVKAAAPLVLASSVKSLSNRNGSNPNY
jgi:hypothetical protein